MKNARSILETIASLGVIAVGLYMFINFAWPTPPAISGLGFFLAGLAICLKK